jgi:hypothetical protein
MRWPYSIFRPQYQIFLIKRAYDKITSGRAIFGHSNDLSFYWPSHRERSTANSDNHIFLEEIFYAVVFYPMKKITTALNKYHKRSNLHLVDREDVVPTKKRATENVKSIRIF